MKLLISEDLILTDKNVVNLQSFTEYGMTYYNIKLCKLTDTFKNSDETYDKLLLMPMTHINNIWHLMHHIFITYKYLKKNNVTCDMMYPIFFKGFYERQGILTECRYNDLIFKGLGLNYNKFKKNHDIFKKNEYINVNNIYHVNESINFYNEPLFNDFKKTLLNNFGIEYKKTNSKNITFILRNGSREITNIDYVKDKLQSFNINYIYLENHTVQEQLEIIANTDILIGVHGAGLSWCIFMKNGSTLIEMYPGNSNTDNYIRWCNIASVKYKRMCINITTGIASDFRNATVNINEEQLKLMQTYV
jgi:hypothetical protein